MKNINNLTILSAMAALTVSCAIPDETAPAGAEAVIATIGAETRTAIGAEEDGARKVIWSEGDRIKISTGKNQGIYRAADYGRPTASFLPEDASKDLDFTGGAIAGYPADEMYIGAPDDNTELYFTIPEEQNYIPGSFDSGSMPMISDIFYGPELKFHNAAGVLRLDISTEEPEIIIKDITITAPQTISGECGYIPASKKIFFDGSMLGSNFVTLNCGDGVSVSSDPTPFYIVVPHQTYTGMTIDVTTTDNKKQTFRMKEGKEITVKRSSISTIPLELDDVADSQAPRVKISNITVTYDDIKIDVEIRNTTAYYCGVQTKLDFMNDLESGKLLESIPYLTQYTTPLTYSGSVTKLQEELADLWIEPAQSYVIWFIPYKKDGLYTVDDIFYEEAMTKAYASGGSVSVTYKNVNIDMTSISMTLSASGSTAIYSLLVPESNLEQYPTDDSKIDLLLNPNSGSTVFDTSEDLLIRKFLRPGARMVLLATAIDRAGRYGPLLTEVFATDPLPYNNSLQVKIDKDLEALRSTSEVSWSTTGGEAVEYRYLFKNTDGYLWSNTLEKSVEYAQEMMYISPGLYYITSTVSPTATLSSLNPGTEYILVVVAVDADGNISKSDSWRFTY